MKCPTCNADTRVLSTVNHVRRRECFNLHRFSTLEVLHDPGEEKRVIRRVQVEAMKKAKEEMDAEREAIKKAEGTLQNIANQFGRSVSYVWKVRKATA